MKKCGCRGEIKQGTGCLKYFDSDAHNLDADHEGMMRAGGLGFGTRYNDFDAMMSMYLQANGLNHDAASTILQG